MSKFKYRVELHISFDEEDYPTPSDGNLGLQLKEDMIDAIESTVPVQINAIKITRTGKIKDAEPDNYDPNEP